MKEQKTDWRELEAGDHHYKAYVGPPRKYDLLGALQFTLLTAAGLRSRHRLCDIGCGSLRAGKLLIPYLEKDHYYGIDPEKWLVDQATEEELGGDLLRIKQPRFHYSSHFDLKAFGQKFDYLLAQSIFSHAAPRQIERCFREAAAVMHGKSYFLATFMPGDSDYQGTEWVYPGCVTYRPETVQKMAREAGLIAYSTDWPHPNDQEWYLLTLNREGSKKPAISHFSLMQYQYKAPPQAAKPSVWKRVKYHLKRLVGQG